MSPFVAGVVAMALIVAASNFLVQIPINDWLTWGALSYPVAFLVTDLINRRIGPDATRRVVYVGFACGVALSLYPIVAEIGRSVITPIKSGAGSGKVCHSRESGNPETFVG